MVELTMGWVLTRLGKYGEASDVYNRLRQRADAPEFIRNRANLLGARVVAAQGYAEQALAELDKLAEKRAWQVLALDAKIRTLLRAGREEEADLSLARLREIAEEAKDSDVLRRVAEVHLLANRTKEALALCDQVEALSPDDARSYLLRAAILAGAGRGGEVPAVLEKVLEIQPGNLKTHVALAKVLDSQQRPRRALDVLDRMAKLGWAGRTWAMFERGKWFVRWGLYTQAIECFDQLMGEGHGGIAELQLSLGQAFVRVGQMDRAHEVLNGIRSYSGQYAPAQQLLARIAGPVAKKLSICLCT